MITKRKLCFAVLVFACFSVLSLAQTVDLSIVSTAVRSAPKIDGVIDDACWSKAESTGPMKVLGGMSETILGLWVEAEEKFGTNASSAQICHDDNNLYIAMRVPAPADVPVEANVTKFDGAVWGDDAVELFFDPLRDLNYYQILTNAIGTVSDLYCEIGKENDFGWNANAVVKITKNGAGFDVEMAIPFSSFRGESHENGAAWGVNFAREGKSCGGHSTWAPVGTNFGTPDKFGLLIFGSRDAYYRKVLGRLLGDSKKLGKDVDSRLIVSIQNKIKSAEKMVAEGNVSLADFNRRVEKIEKVFELTAMNGRTYLLWTKSIWGNISPNEKISADTKELKSLKIVSALNSRSASGFLVSNLSDKPLMGRLILEEPVRGENKKSLSRENLNLRRGVYIELNSGKMIPDALVTLPAGDLIEVPPGTTQLIWIEVDASKLTAGSYTNEITFLPSYSGYNVSKFNLCVDVLPVDLAKPMVNNFTYTSRGNLDRFEFIADDLAHHGVTNSYLIWNRDKIKPEFDKDGNIVKMDTSAIDATLVNMQKAGTSVDRIRLLFYLAMEHKWSRDFNVRSPYRIKYGTPIWKKAFIGWLCALRDHLADKGVDAESIIIMPVDEPEGNPDDSNSKAHYAFEIAEIVKEADPEIRLFANPYIKRDGMQYMQKWFDVFDIIEPYCGFLIQDSKLVKACQDSGKEICLYGIYSKSTAPGAYRKLFWYSAKFQFAGSSAFWCYDQFSGDMFNSYDASKYNAKVKRDYGIAYVDFANKKVIPSRRWEAYYQGNQDFRAIKIYRKLIADLKAKGQDVSVYEAKLDTWIEKGIKGNHAQMNAVREEILQSITTLSKYRRLLKNTPI